MNPSPIERAARPRAWLFLLLLALGVAAHEGRAADAERTPLQTFAQTLGQIDKQLTKGDVEEATLKLWSDQIALERVNATDCIAAGEKALVQLKGSLDSLGAPAKNEAGDVVRKRREFGKAIGDSERQLAECKVLLLRSDELLERIGKLYKAELAKRVLAKGPNIVQVLLDNWHNAVTLLAATLLFVREHAGFNNLGAAEWTWLVLLVVAAFAAGTALRRQQRPRLADRITAADGSVSSSANLLAAFLHYLPRLLAACTAAVFIYLVAPDISPVPFINVVLYGLPVYLAGLLCIHLALAPRPPGRRLVAVDDALARGMARRLQVLALLAYVGYLVFSTLFAQHLPEDAYLLMRAVYATLLFMNLIWALWLFARMREQDALRWLGLVMSLVLVVSLGAEWLGYRNLALLLLRVVLGSLIGLGVTLLVARLFDELYAALEGGETPWGARMRQWLGVAPGRTLPGLLWFRLATTVLIWVLFGYALLRIWHVPAGAIQQVEDTLIRGFKIGELQVVPYRILLAVALFALLVALARWLQTRMDRRWLRYARMDHGAREAAVTIAGYVLIVFAALIGLSVAGFDFTKLALIAGALSVGIGFGLQNIVNNFVSGLILLFERPVKTGDWVVVGNTEGYVRRISIRSTQIQTFDQADVIVPNSELIAHQVTNWMLHNRQGRAHIPVGVAYGSDVEKVKRVLERIAGEHPGVITDGSSPEPKALFLGFGETALSFDLRCFVRNIDERGPIVSDLNFAIYAAFQAEGIEMPCPNKTMPAK